jgi:hypothetical protein
MTMERQTCVGASPCSETLGVTPKGNHLSDLTAQKRALAKPEAPSPRVPRPRLPDTAPRRDAAPRNGFSPDRESGAEADTTGVRLASKLSVEDRISSVMPSAAALPKGSLDISFADDQTRQYKVPPDVLERFLTSKARKSERAVQQQATSNGTTAPPPNTSHEEGPPTSAPLPRFSSPRVPSDLFPITASEDHELSDDATVNMPPMDIPLEARREPTLLTSEPALTVDETRRRGRGRQPRPVVIAAEEPIVAAPDSLQTPADNRRYENFQLLLASVLLIALGVLTGLSLRGF